MFCDKCGAQAEESGTFCADCGTQINGHFFSFLLANFKNQTEEGINRAKKFSASLSRKDFLIGVTLLLLILGVSYAAFGLYNSYVDTQSIIQRTSKELQETKDRLSAIASSTSDEFLSQAKELTAKSDEIKRLEAQLKSSVNTTSASPSTSLLNSLASSVVKIVCLSNAQGDAQIGSGVLYYSADGDPATYFIETNLHVVQTEDGSVSQCAIAVYPNYKLTSSYLLYRSSGFKVYRYGVDFAYLIPTVTDTESAGTLSDLSKYAKVHNSNTYCKSTNIGERVSILGYPSVGGYSLTVTDGIISGFEYESGARYIKTSAKIEHGNSGGVAVKESGCVLGIPTYVATGRVESIGRILDLYSLFN